MMIFTLCIDPERGRYLAFNGNNPEELATSFAGASEAVVELLRRYETTVIDGVFDLDEIVDKSK